MSTAVDRIQAGVPSERGKVETIATQLLSLVTYRNPFLLAGMFIPVLPRAYSPETRTYSSSRLSVQMQKKLELRRKRLDTYTTRVEASTLSE